jgi:hypothetical protein
MSILTPTDQLAPICVAASPSKGVRTNPVLDLAPAYRSRNRESRLRPRRPGANGRHPAAVSQIIDEDAAGALLRVGGECVPVRCSCREALREPLGVRPRLIVVDLRLKRRHQVQSLAPGQLRPRLQTFIPQHPAEHKRRLDHELPGDTVARIEIEDEQVGVLYVIDARVPLVQLDCADLD